MDRAPQAGRLRALALGRRDVHRQQHRRRGVDGHAGAYFVQRDSLEEPLHFLQAEHRNAHAPHFAARQLVVRVVADLGGQVERHREAGLSLPEQVAVARVGFLGGGVPGVLAHRPQPAAVHRRLHAARERILPREADPLRYLRVRFGRRVNILERNAGGGLKAGFALGEFFQRRPEHFFLPPAQGVRGFAGHTILRGGA